MASCSNQRPPLPIRALASDSAPDNDFFRDDYLAAAAVGSPAYAWVGWLSLLPLFFPIRLLRPLRALACGALWGASLFVFCVAGGRTTVPATASSFLLLAGIPAIYTFAGAALTRWIGFSPFVLGVGWMGVELALAPLGFHNGLLSASQGDTALMHYVGRALGYVLVGFLVAYVNAALVAVVAGVRLRSPRLFLSTRSGNGVLFLRSQIVGCLSLVTLQPSRPRAPPLRSIAVRLFCAPGFSPRGKRKLERRASPVFEETEMP